MIPPIRNSIKQRVARRRQQQAPQTPLDAILEPEKPMPTPEPPPLKPQANPVLKPDPLNYERIATALGAEIVEPENMTPRQQALAAMADPRAGMRKGLGGPVSPKARDERMARKGRLPHGSWFVTDVFDGAWDVTLYVPYDGADDMTPCVTPTGSEMNCRVFTTANNGIHAALEALWGQFCQWKAEQSATKESS